MQEEEIAIQNMDDLGGCDKPLITKEEQARKIELLLSYAKHKNKGVKSLLNEHEFKLILFDYINHPNQLYEENKKKLLRGMMNEFLIAKQECAYWESDYYEQMDIFFKRLKKAKNKYDYLNAKYKTLKKELEELKNENNNR